MCLWVREREINNLVESMLVGIEAAGFRASRAGVRKLTYIKDVTTGCAFSVFVDNLFSIPAD